MPALTNHHDLDAAALKRAGQDDPWVMYLIVRRELELTEAEIYEACAAATLRCVADYGADPLYHDAFAAWFDLSFRKVTLRANPLEWGRVNQFDSACARAQGAAAVIALPPRLKSAREPELTRLQVYNPDREKLAVRQQPGLRLALNVVIHDVGMGVGKTAAQVAHAALMAVRSPLVDDPRYQAAFARWQDGPLACRVFAAPTADWARLKDELDCVVVRDAGLTEVDPGTETVLAAPPTGECPPALSDVPLLGK
jgi:peptidyl-tRNA hydrolase